MDLPLLHLPQAPKLERMTLDIPTADIPYYKPMVVPPSDLRPPAGIKSESTETTKQVTTPTFKLPMVDIEMPLPTTEVVMTATYAAVSAVAVTTFAQPLFNFIKKQIQKRLQNKIDKWKKKRLLKDNQKVS